jgi:hypothetical protein
MSATTTLNLSESAQARLREQTHMIYYSSQLIEMDQKLRMFESCLRLVNLNEIWIFR